MTKEEYKAVRRCRGTWKQVAAALGVSWTTVARRETGEIPVSGEAAVALMSLPVIWFDVAPPLPAGYKPVPGYHGYAATRDGRVFSCRSKYPDKSLPFKAWAEIKATKGTRGYWVIALVNGNGRRQLKLHQVILLAFRGPPAPGLQGRHLNDNPDDNFIDNLEWGTSKENRADLIRNGRIPDRKGMKHPLAKLNDLQVAAIRSRRAAGETLGKISKDFGVSEATVSLLARNKTWKN